MVTATSAVKVSPVVGAMVGSGLGRGEKHSNFLKPVQGSCHAEACAPPKMKCRQGRSLGDGVHLPR